MSDETLRQAIIDEEHLKLLSIGYLVSAGVAALFSLFGLLYVIMGVTMGIIFREAAKKGDQSPPPAFMGWVFGIVMQLYREHACPKRLPGVMPASEAETHFLPRTRSK